MALSSGRPCHRAARVRFQPTVDLMEGRTLLSILVSNTDDSGPGSLRAAIAQADTTPGTITFDPSVTGTINLLSALPDLNANITIQGPGPKVLAVALSTAPGTSPFRLFNVTAGSEVTISGLEIRGGIAADGLGGGGIDNAGTLTVTDCSFNGNWELSTGDLGGGISNKGTLTVRDSSFSSNTGYGSGGGGGGIFNSGPASVTGCTFTGNQGGGIENAGTMTVTDSTFRGNAGGEGGAISNGASAVLMVSDSIFAGNSSNGGMSAGVDGVIYNVGTLTVTGCTLDGNVGQGAGAIGNRSSGTLTVVNSTFSGNSALNAGAIFNSGVRVAIANSTFSGNAAGSSGAGIVSNIGTVTATDSIFAGSKGGNLLIGGVFRSGGHNLFTDVPAVSLDPTDLTDTDPLLAPLGDNGGPTPTQALLPGSPAIDAGAPVTGVTTDQRGVPRPQGLVPDIGAFESRGFTLTIVSGDGQTGHAGSAFPAPLIVRVASPFGEPVAGGRVTFAAPSAGATAVLNTNLAAIDASGQAVVIATANGIGGTYAVTVRTAGGMDVAFTLANLAPPKVTGVVSVSHSKKGIKQIILGFSEDLIFSSATNGSFFSLASGVKKRNKLVFRKPVKIKGVSYDSAARQVTIRLAKPFKGRVQITVHGGIMATNGLASHGDFTAVVK
jgi:hypothetical protein